MGTWKLSIKPDSQEGFDPFEVCKRNSLIGIGWSYIYENNNIKTKDEAYKVLSTEESFPQPVRILLDDVSTGDYVWLHQQGSFFLCKVENDEAVLGPSISNDFMKCDLGHARNATWVKVPSILVSGRVQRGAIAQRMIQRIRCDKLEEQVFEYLHSKLSSNPNWQPELNDDEIFDTANKLSNQDVKHLLTPDDYEDIVAAFLQSDGWILLKSTCFRSKPKFEFMMLKPGPSYGHVQVKSGNIQLPPSEYTGWVSKTDNVFLFSTHSDPYPGQQIRGVNTISFDEIFIWLKANIWAISPSLKMKIQLVSEIK